MACDSFPQKIEGARIHFVGVKGTGMAALVELLHAQGALITGSDVSEIFYTDEILSRLKITPLPFDARNVTAQTQLVIYSSAYDPQKNPDLIRARELKIPALLYSEALGALSARSYSAGVCGVHGKTSTTGLVGTILSRLPLASQALAGSVISSFGNSCAFTSESFNGAGRKYFVAETCEYERHFMSFHPQKIILTSVESDHQDFYPTYGDIRDAFVDYVCLLPKNGDVIYCADDAGAVDAVARAKSRRPDINAIPYGESAEGEYKISFGCIKDCAQRFSLGCLSDIALRVSGRHEALDAAAAVALSRELLKADGKDPRDFDENIKRGVAAFVGGKRRSEIVGRKKFALNDVLFIDDYGHHPTAIKKTLEGYREFYAGRKIVVDFMSHTYTRTAALLDEFASSFGAADEVIINKIYGSAREDASAAKVTGKTLAARASLHHGHVVYAAEFDEAAAVARESLSRPLDARFPNGCLFVTMGAGDNWKVGAALLRDS